MLREDTMFARDRYCRWLAAMAIMAALTCGAQAQTAPASDRYPERTVRFIVPVSPGALIDSFARVLAAGLQALWGQSVVVENKTGSAGVTGVVAGLQSPPDGYTFVFMGVTSQVIAGAFRDPPPYDPRKDWNPVAITGKCTFVFLVNDQLPVKNLRDMVAYIKARPGQLNYGSGGVGSINHLGMEIFKRTTGTQMTHIPFRGGSEAVIGLTNNSIQVYLTDITAANSAVGMGKSAIIGQLGSSRSPMVPDVPAMSEEGLTPLEAFPWVGLVAPLAVPPAIVEKVNRDVNRVLGDPEWKGRAQKLGCDVVTGPPSTFSKVIEDNVNLWTPAAREIAGALNAK
jgi:tripartite-type tricarboxylate transporter receptor subunit TctC